MATLPGKFLFRAASAASVIAAATISSAAIAQSRLQAGSIPQPPPRIVHGDFLMPGEEQELGLVTVGGGCSGTLVNRSWVLTADHCLSANPTNPQAGDPPRPLSSLTITASWTKLSAVPTDMVRYAIRTPGSYFKKPFAGRDVALLYLGNTDLGPARIQLFYVEPVDTHVIIKAYGRGIYEYAKGLYPAATPAQQDGKYRYAQFMVNAAVVGTDYTYYYGGGQMVAGGDSGGPDIVVGYRGVPGGIAGVHSVCYGLTYMQSAPRIPPPPQTWNWVTSINHCTSAALYDIRDDIVKRIQTHPNPYVRAPAGVATRLGHP